MPEGTEIEIHAPAFKIYGEDYAYLFDDIRSKGCHKVHINGELYYISEEIELDEAVEYDIQVVIDKFFIKEDIDKQILAALDRAMLVGKGFLSFHILNPEIADDDTTRVL